MGYRVFRDSRGVEWQAWDVVPKLTERRELERRMKRSPVEQERRRMQDRRLVHGRRPVLTAGLDAGWLCFESGTERRRHAPVPADWATWNDARLEACCRDAVRVVRRAAS